MTNLIILPGLVLRWLPPCSPHNFDLVQRLGADAVFDYVRGLSFSLSNLLIMMERSVTLKSHTLSKRQQQGTLCTMSLTLLPQKAPHLSVYLRSRTEKTLRKRCFMLLHLTLSYLP